MSKADELFNQAYHESVVEERHREAIELCRRALTIEPRNPKVKTFLGMLLSDYGTEDEQNESYKHFLDAIQSSNREELCDNWFEESALHHLAIWKWDHDDYVGASLFFLADVLACHSAESEQRLFKLLDEMNPVTSAQLKTVISCIVAAKPLNLPG